jgi:hypothetical protein
MAPVKHCRDAIGEEDWRGMMMTDVVMVMVMAPVTR